MLASPRLRATKLTFWDMAKQYIALPACGLGENASLLSAQLLEHCEASDDPSNIYASARESPLI
jgi:hypothetical protein